MNNIMNIKISSLIAVIAGVSIISSGIAFVATKVSVSSNMAVSCPKAAPQSGWVLPSGPVPDLHSGKKY